MTLNLHFMLPECVKFQWVCTNVIKLFINCFIKIEAWRELKGNPRTKCVMPSSCELNNKNIANNIHDSRPLRIKFTQNGQHWIEPYWLFTFRSWILSNNDSKDTVLHKKSFLKIQIVCMQVSKELLSRHSIKSQDKILPLRIFSEDCHNSKMVRHHHPDTKKIDQMMSSNSSAL